MWLSATLCWRLLSNPGITPTSRLMALTWFVALLLNLHVGGQTWFFFFFFFFMTLMWAGSCSSPCERVLRLTPIKPLFVAKVVKGQRRWHFNGAAPIQPFNVVTGRCRRLWTNHIAERGRGQTGFWLAADTSDWSLHNCGCTEPKIKYLFVFQYMSSIFIYLFIFLIYFAVYLLRNNVNLTDFFLRRLSCYTCVQIFFFFFFFSPVLLHGAVSECSLGFQRIFNPLFAAKLIQLYWTFQRFESSNE